MSEKKLPIIESYIKKAIFHGAIAAKIIDASTIETAAWVRIKCRYGCTGYGGSLCCPPHTPTPKEMREVIDCYKTAVLFEVKGDDPSKVAYDIEREIFLDGYYKAFGMGAGPCFRCENGCVFEKGCVHGGEARPALEACGIDVYKTVRRNGYEIEVVKSQEEQQHYYGIVLIE